MNAQDQPRGDSASPDGWEKTWDHLREGYKNGQEAIRAVDTKVSILTGLATFALAATAGTVGVACDWLRNDLVESRQLVCTISAPSIFLLLFALAGVASIMLGVGSIWCSMQALTPRQRKPFTNLPSTALFPFLPHAKDAEGKRQQALQHYRDILRRDLNSADVRKEYEDQIQNIGNILGQKIAHCDSAVHWFRAQILAVAFAATMVVGFVALCLVCPPQSKSGPTDHTRPSLSAPSASTEGSAQGE